MSLKKFLRSYLVRLGERAGQATTEYFILLVLLATLTIIGGSAFFSQVQTTTDQFASTAASKMNQTDVP